MSTITLPQQYINVNLPQTGRLPLSVALQTAMHEKKLYRDQQMTLNKMARQLGVSRHQLSRYVNNSLKLDFSSYLNSFRLNEVVDALMQSDMRILEAAYAAGFNSKATFNRIFKKKIGMTPREFRRVQKTTLSAV